MTEMSGKIGTRALRAYIRDMLFWIPTREAQLVREHADLIPENAIVRLSPAMIDGPAPKDWLHTSTVLTAKATCPSSMKGATAARTAARTAGTGR